jgi:uncharacterized YccA/Bax inhibitor family protein
MALMKSSNPALSGNAFRSAAGEFGEPMTVSGTVNKTGILLVCVMATAVWSWNRFLGDPDGAMPLLAIGAIGGLVLAVVTIFKKAWAPVTAPIYALLEGLVLGGISVIYETRFHGIVIQAVGLTFGVLLAMLLAYRTGFVRATENFKLGVIAATGGIALFYVAELVLGFFGIHFAAINGSGGIGIAFSLFVVVIASLNLVLDFDFIERGAQSNAPKYMEWYGGFALMVTLIWLYLEILNLLGKSRRR